MNYKPCNYKISREQQNQINSNNQLEIKINKQQDRQSDNMLSSKQREKRSSTFMSGDSNMQNSTALMPEGEEKTSLEMSETLVLNHNFYQNRNNTQQSSRNRTTLSHSQEEKTPQKKMVVNNPQITVEGITEEMLDDWIAQSSNRPILSYLDPYKQFQAPSSFLRQLKQRYQQPDKNKDILCKSLYFEKPSVSHNVSRLYNQKKSISLEKKEIPLIFDHSKLTPQVIQGSSIRIREDQIPKSSPLYPEFSQMYCTKKNRKILGNNFKKFKLQKMSSSLVINTMNHEETQTPSGPGMRKSIIQQQNLTNAKSDKPNKTLFGRKQKKVEINVSQITLSSQNNNYTDPCHVNSVKASNLKEVQYPQWSNEFSSNQSFNPDKDINYDIYDKKHVQVFRGLQSRFNKQIQVNTSSPNNIFFTQRPESVSQNFQQSGSKSNKKQREIQSNKSSRSVTHGSKNIPIEDNENISVGHDDICSQEQISLNDQGKDHFKSQNNKVHQVKPNQTPKNFNNKSGINNESQKVNPKDSQLNLIGSSYDNTNAKAPPSGVNASGNLKGTKQVKEETLDLDIIKKVNERVGRLLDEKDGRIQNDIDDQNVPNERNPDRFITDKVEEVGNGQQTYNEHIPEMLETVKTKGYSDAAINSFYKGVRRMKIKNDKGAMTAFRQALNFDRTNFHSIFNIACLYERNKKFKIAEQWIEIAAIFKKYKNEVDYAFALIYFKTNRFEEAFKKIDGLIEDFVKANTSDQISVAHLYLRSIVAKKMGQKLDEKETKLEDKQIQRAQAEESSQVLIQPSQQINISNPRAIRRSQRKTNQEEEKKVVSISWKEEKVKREVPSQGTPSDSYLKKSNDDYKILIGRTCPKNFILLRNLMFAIVFKRIRKMEIRLSPHIQCEFISLIQQILAVSTYSPLFESLIASEQIKMDIDLQAQIMTMLGTKQSEGRRKLVFKAPPLIQGEEGLRLAVLAKSKDEIIKRVSPLPFFKRFPATVIDRFLGLAEVRYKEKNNLMFAKKGEVFVITGGHVQVLDHSKVFSEPEIVAFYSEGDIIGCDEKDNRISFHVDIWFLALTRLEYLVFNEGDFNELWNMQNTLQPRSTVQFLKQIDIFANVSQLSIYSLAFQLLEPKLFSKGDIVYNDGEFVQKYNYITLTKEDPKTLRDLPKRIHNKIDIIPLTQMKIPGFFIVQDGVLELKSHGNWQQYSLQTFNYVGENLLFPSLSVSRFGQIICAAPNTKCLFLSRQYFYKLNSLDVEIMKNNIQRSDYFANCQRILYKYYTHFRMDESDIHNLIH